MWNIRRFVTHDQPEVSRLQLPVLAPVSGRVCLLDEVPSPAYANGLFGAGIAIDLSGYKIQAPFDGVWLDHSVTGECLRIKSRQGLELLIQVGIDSHKLMGQGFRFRSARTGSFSQGETLLEFDLRLVKNRARSAHCLVLTSQTQKLSAIQAHCHSVLACQEPCMTLHFR